MVITNQKDKERSICKAVKTYMERDGYNKAKAVRQVMVDYNYATEAAIYGILKRNKEREAQNGERTA